MSGELVPTPLPRMDGDQHVMDIGQGLITMIDHGLVWALNTYALHPRGCEMRTDGTVVTIAGDGRRILQWTEEQADAADRRWRQFEQTILHARQYNWPGHWEGNSPGFNHRPANRQAAQRRSGRRIGR